MSKAGAHPVLSLDAAEVCASWLTSLRDDARTRLREAKISVGRPAVADNEVQVRLAKPEDADAAVKALADLSLTVPTGLVERFLAQLRGLGSDVTVVKSEGGIVTITPTEAGLARRTDAALDNAVTIVGRRLEGMGFTATTVRQGRDRTGRRHL
jgi:preprotein translocase subunit SecD